MAEDFRTMMISLILQNKEMKEMIDEQNSKLQKADQLCKSFEPIAKKIEQRFNTKI